MKKVWVVTAVVATALSAGVVATHALDKGARRDRGCDEGRDHKRPGARLAKELGLSAEQEKQLSAIHEAERRRAEPVFEKLDKVNEQLREAADAKTFDEAAVRALARTQADLSVELTVSRMRAQHEANAVLTPEQREKAKKLPRPFGPPPGPGFGQPPGPPPRR